MRERDLSDGLSRMKSMKFSVLMAKLYGESDCLMQQETAEERRGFRTNRRRLDRRNWRLELLQEIFAEEINQVDDGFFLRMKESRYLPEDKRGKDGNCPELPYAIFADHDYTDKNYHKQFPTIYICENGLWKRQIPPIFDWSIWLCIIW